MSNYAVGSAVSDVPGTFQSDTTVFTGVKITAAWDFDVQGSSDVCLTASSGDAVDFKDDAVHIPVTLNESTKTNSCDLDNSDQISDNPMSMEDDSCYDVMSQQDRQHIGFREQTFRIQMDGKGKDIRGETTRSQEEDNEGNKILDQTVSGIKNPEKLKICPKNGIRKRPERGTYAQATFGNVSFKRNCQPPWLDKDRC